MFVGLTSSKAVVTSSANSFNFCLSPSKGWLMSFTASNMQQYLPHKESIVFPKSGWLKLSRLQSALTVHTLYYVTTQLALILVLLIQPLSSLSTVCI